MDPAFAKSALLQQHFEEVQSQIQKGLELSCLLKPPINYAFERKNAHVFCCVLTSKESEPDSLTAEEESLLSIDDFDEIDKVVSLPDEVLTDAELYE